MSHEEEFAMKILNINSYYYSSSVHRHLQKALADRGIDSTTYVPLAKGYVPREDCKYGVEERIDASECYEPKDRYAFHIKHHKILKDVLRRYDFGRFDCVHAHSLFSNGYIALQIKEKTGLPYIVAVRDTDLNVFFRYMVYLRTLGVQILLQAEKVVFLSDSYRNQLVSQYVPDQYKRLVLEKSVVIPNGIDAFWIENTVFAGHKIDADNIRLIFAGQITKRKNLISVKKACDLLMKEGVKIHFKIVGEAVDPKVMGRLLEAKFIEHVDRVKKEELMRLYRNSDIYVMPSITETFGLSYAEAMSQGLPVVYTKGQGFDGQFEEGLVGYPVDCFNVEEIARRIQDIAGNYDEISSFCARNANRFDWTKISKDYEDLYREAGSRQDSCT
jgi:glycosyltransferase involved in cell wall biosynthesis